MYDPWLKMDNKIWNILEITTWNKFYFFIIGKKSDRITFVKSKIKESIIEKIEKACSTREEYQRI